MSKRFQPMKEFGRTSKKPKLDISINKRSSTAAPGNVQANAALWDDDEDDVILLASQMVESEIFAPRANQTVTESEITFSEFEPRIQQHSTQRPVGTKNDNEDLFSQMFDDDDDLIRVAAAAAEKEANTQQLRERDNYESEVFEFQRPELPSRSSSKQPKPIFAIKSQDLAKQPSTSAESRRNLATERQVQYLMERLEALKQENAKLNQDLGSVKDNMQVKIGEASMLRDELRRAKQQVEAFKMEKLKQTETVNAQSKLKIEQLNKEIKTKESQLQIKNMECSVLKMRQADESRRLEMSLRETTTTTNAAADDTTTTAAAAAEKHRSFAETLALTRLSKLKITCDKISKKNESLSTLLTKDAFERADEHGISRKFNTFFQQEVENIQFILAQIQLPTKTFDKDKLIDSVRRVFSEFWTYVHTLAYVVYEKVLPYHGYDVLADASARKEGCLLLKDALYDKERGVNIRRYMAALSALCQQSELAARLILNTQHEEHPLLNIVIDAIIDLGFSDEISEHFGIIEACAALARSLLLHLKPAGDDKDKIHFDTVFKLIQYLVFTRPNPWTLYEISYSVLDCAHRSLPFLSKLCINSKRQHFQADRLNERYRFTNDACFLEVYCGLVESAFPLYMPLSSTHFELQLKLCLNHIRFVFNCLTEPPEFVQKFLNVEEDYDFEGVEESGVKAETASDKAQKQKSKEKTTESKMIIEDEAPSTSKQAAAKKITTDSKTIVDDSSATIDADAASCSAASQTASDIKCECLVQMCISAVVMIYLSLRQWLRMDKEVQTERVGFISRHAVHLLYAMFCYDFGCEFHAAIFRDNEVTTKHYFYLICTWWQENAAELKFTDMHMNILKKLIACHAMPKLIKDLECKRENITADMEGWNKATNQNCDTSLIDADVWIKKLNLIEDMFDPEKLFAVLRKDHIKNLKAWNDP